MDVLKQDMIMVGPVPSDWCCRVDIHCNLDTCLYTFQTVGMDSFEGSRLADSGVHLPLAIL